MYYGCVIMYEDCSDGESRDLCDEDASKGVGNRGIDADEGEGGIVGGVLVKLDVEALQHDRK